MKKSFYCFFILLLLVKISFGQLKESSQPKFTELINLNTRTNNQLKNLNYLYFEALDGNILYLIDSKNNLIEVDLITQVVVTNIQVSTFLKNKLSKQNKRLTGMVVKNNCFYFNFFNEIISFSKTGKETPLFKFSNKIIWSFQVLDNGDFILARPNEILLVNKTGQKIDSFNENLASQFFSAKNGIGYDDIEHQVVFTVKNSKIQKLSYDANKLPDYEDFCISAETSKYFVGFYFRKRNLIHFLSKQSPLKVVKTIKLPEDISISLPEIQDEEGVPNFKVFEEANSYYVISLRKGRFRIFKIS